MKRDGEKMFSRKRNSFQPTIFLGGEVRTKDKKTQRGRHAQRPATSDQRPHQRHHRTWRYAYDTNTTNTTTLWRYYHASSAAAKTHPLCLVFVAGRKPIWYLVSGIEGRVSPSLTSSILEPKMSVQHWQSFRASSSPRFDASLPIHSVEYERQRRKRECSLKSLFCCLKILVGKKSSRSNNIAEAKRRQTQIALLRTNNTDDSFGYNFDDHQPPSQKLSGSSENNDHIVD